MQQTGRHQSVSFSSPTPPGAAAAFVVRNVRMSMAGVGWEEEEERKDFYFYFFLLLFGYFLLRCYARCCALSGKKEEEEKADERIKETNGS